MHNFDRILRFYAVGFDKYIFKSVTIFANLKGSVLDLKDQINMSVEIFGSSIGR